jgi:hypothetical protein
MASLQTLERRIIALEARLAEVEGGYGETMYKLHRPAVRTDLNVGKILEHQSLASATDDEIDTAMDAE